MRSKRLKGDTRWFHISFEALWLRIDGCSQCGMRHGRSRVHHSAHQRQCTPLLTLWISPFSDVCVEHWISWASPAQPLVNHSVFYDIHTCGYQRVFVSLSPYFVLNIRSHSTKCGVGFAVTTQTHRHTSTYWHSHTPLSRCCRFKHLTEHRNINYAEYSSRLHSTLATAWTLLKQRRIQYDSVSRQRRIVHSIVVRAFRAKTVSKYTRIYSLDAVISCRLFDVS